MKVVRQPIQNFRHVSTFIVAIQLRNRLPDIHGAPPSGSVLCGNKVLQEIVRDELMVSTVIRESRGLWMIRRPSAQRGYPWSSRSRSRGELRSRRSGGARRQSADRTARAGLAR